MRCRRKPHPSNSHEESLVSRNENRLRREHCGNTKNHWLVVMKSDFRENGKYILLYTKGVR